MKKILLLLAFLPLCFISCSNEDDAPKEPVLSNISKAELEAVPSFSFWDKEDNDMLYIKFRDSKLYTKQVVSTGYVCNENIMSYVINGDKIEVTFNIYGNDVTFDGTIYKVTEEKGVNSFGTNDKISIYVLYSSVYYR